MIELSTVINKYMRVYAYIVRRILLDLILIVNTIIKKMITYSLRNTQIVYNTQFYMS